MKKLYVLLLITLLTFNPILVFATETTGENINNATNESNSNTSEVMIPAVDNPEQSSPTPEGSTNDNNIVPDTPSTAEGQTGNLTELPSEKTTGIEDLPTNDNNPSIDDSNGISTAEDGTDDTVEDLQGEHKHTFVYTSNDDGTHTITCSNQIEGDDEKIDCEYNEIEKCTFDEDNKCIYCGYIKPDEVEDFSPSISFSISNQTCVIGESSPIICVSLTQDEYDIAYAQVCFAYYGQKKFINIGLAHGKYFDPYLDEYIYTSDNNWYARPLITSDYVEGDYSLRSIYVRASNGESIHYSIESDSLPDSYKNISISLVESPPIVEETISDDSPIVEDPIITGDEKSDEITDNTGENNPSTNNDSSESNAPSAPSTPGDDNTDIPSEDTGRNNEHASPEPSQNDNKNNNDNNNSNNSNNNSNGNTGTQEDENGLGDFFKFLKKLFGWG